MRFLERDTTDSTMLEAGAIGGILALVGVIVLTESGFGSDLLRWWPLLIIGAGIVVLVSALSRRSDRRAP